MAKRTGSQCREIAEKAISEMIESGVAQSGVDLAHSAGLSRSYFSTNPEWRAAYKAAIAQLEPRQFLRLESEVAGAIQERGWASKEVLLDRLPYLDYQIQEALDRVVGPTIAPRYLPSGRLIYVSIKPRKVPA